MINSTILILVICFLANEAAVLRTSDKHSGKLESTTAADILSTTLEPEPTTIENQDLITTPKGALSRDEEATILIVDQTLLDSEPVELTKSETQTIDLEKFGKLLLLSTPKIAEKPKEPEENLEESEEENERVENVTQISMETTTAIQPTNEESTTFLNADDEISRKGNLNIDDQTITILPTTEKSTKLYPINDTLYADNKKIIKNETQENSDAVVEDQPKEALSAKLVSVILAEPDADYVLVESEALQGSYTDVESELHLQPIVQSVEIVPSSLDDTLLISYVPSW